VRCVCDIAVPSEVPPEIRRRYRLSDIAAAISSKELVPIGWHEHAVRDEYGAVAYDRTEARLCGNNIKRLEMYRLGYYPGIYAMLGILRVYLSDGRYVDLPAMVFEKVDKDYGEYEVLAYVPIEMLEKLGPDTYVEETEMIGKAPHWEIVERRVHRAKSKIRA